MTHYEVEEVYSFLKIKSFNGGSHYLHELYERVNKTFNKFNSDDSGTIEYRLNDYGYRSDNNYNDLFYSTNSEDYILGIGCSHTEGIGVKNENTWLEKLGKMTGMKTVNLGLTSGTIDYCNYQLIQLYQEASLVEELCLGKPWKNHNMPIYVFVLAPPSARFSIINSDNITFFQDWNFASEEAWEPGRQGELVYREKGEDVETVANTWSDKYGPTNKWNNRYYKGEVQILNLLQEKYNFFKLDWEEFGKDFPIGIDGSHYDETYHEKIATEFYKEIE